MTTPLKLEIPVIGILRGVTPGFFATLMPRVFKAGLDAIEVTINTADAELIIADNLSRVPKGKYLGMGTIRNPNEAERAMDAGAMFLVTPNLDGDVLALAKDRNIPVVAGALTPTEVYGAWQAGASMIKVFPCSSLGGPAYIKALRGPFDTIPLVAVGGVSRENLHDYFAAGVQAVGVSTTLFGKKAVEAEDSETLVKNVRTFTTIIKQIRF